MDIELVGETIDAKQAHKRARDGTLIQLVRGVYVDHEANIDQTILGHAVRIAHYLYPAAYLSSASAILLGPTPDGRLFISGRRNQRTRLRTLEIIQNVAPEHPSTARAVVGDEIGELHIPVSSPRMRLLEAFRMRSEHAAAITTEMRSQLAARLIEEYDTPEGAADAIWSLARQNHWRKEAEAAERFLSEQANPAKPPANKAAFDLYVAWHGDLVGQLSHDGFEWRWKSKKRRGPKLVRETTPGKLPNIIESLLPEGWLAQILQERDDRDALRAGRRYMSNIAIAASKAEIAELPSDNLTTRLADFTTDGRFTGQYAGPGRTQIEGTFEKNLANIFRQSGTPRLSGVQIKAPMSLRADGALTPATDEPFTHILKPAGAGGFDTLPVVEWLCLELGRAAGFDVPPAALVEMPDGMLPALIVERFDIRRGEEDRRRLALEDFCAILELPASAKYDSTIERVARGLRPLSTNPAADLDLLLRRAVFAWLIGDGDMHLKNLAMLKIAGPEDRIFTSARLAPLYDSVTTRVFPGLSGDRMALKLNGKDDRLNIDDFRNLARTIGLAVGNAETAITGIADRLSARSPSLTPPRFEAHAERLQSMRDDVIAIVTERSAKLVI